MLGSSRFATVAITPDSDAHRFAWMTIGRVSKGFSPCMGEQIFALLGRGKGLLAKTSVVVSAALA